MLTISCYAFHPLAARFVRLWKRVQVVSDWLACVVGMLCCQCVQLPPMSESSSDLDDKEFFMMDSGLNEEPLVPQCVQLDFTPKPQDDPLETRCIQISDLIRSQPTFESLMLTPYQVIIQHPKISPSAPIHNQQPLASGDRAIPALKTIMQVPIKEGAVTAAFQTEMRK